MAEPWEQGSSLTHRKTLPVVDGAYKKFLMFMEMKQPRGLRVRHSYDAPRKVVYLETGSSLAMDTAWRFFRDARLLRR